MSRGGKGNAYSVMSLFTGAGGLDLGLAQAGFSIRLCVEADADARNTLRTNRPAWRLAEPGDIHKSKPETLLAQAGMRRGAVRLLAGGPPCQPFSKSAYWSNGHARRLRDPRARTLRAYLRVMEAVLPDVLLLENVKGLAFNGKDEGLQLLRREIRRINRRHGTRYEPQIIHLNAVDFGVPQLRERVFVIADINGRNLDVPAPTHGEKTGLRHSTAWDAIGDLDEDDWPSELNASGRWAGLLPTIPEGFNYLWHTPRNQQKGSEPLFGWRARYWSFLLKLAKAQPSWTVQAVPGPATGPFHWKSRYLSVAELCRLQTFPDGYRICGSRYSASRQIGNAVPSAIGELLGLEIRRQLLGERVRRELKLVPKHRPDCPRPEKPGRVPREYLAYRGKHKEHPGTGLGPAPRSVRH